MNVLTTTMCYPSRSCPDRGVFVQRRTLSLLYDRRGDAPSGVRVHVVSPQPWCPLLRPAFAPGGAGQAMMVEQPRMLSVPLLSRLTDGQAYARSLFHCIQRAGGVAGAGIDVIDAHFEYPDGVGAWRVGRKLGVPVVVTVRGKIVALSRCPFRRRQIRSMLWGVDAIIAVSESLARWVRHVAGQDLPVNVIPNGVDGTVFNRLDSAQCRTALRWDPNARYVLAVGHFQRIKGFDRLVRVLPTVRQRWGDVRLVLVGSQRGERRYQRQLGDEIARCNEQAIAQTGHAAIEVISPVAPERLNVYYNAADILASTSHSEGWCNAISEALAAGLPVVATDVGGNREQLGSETLGMLVPNGDETALMESIGAALDRVWDRDAIARHGSCRSWLQVGHEVREVFRHVLTSRCRAEESAPWRTISTLTKDDSLLRGPCDSPVKMEGVR